MKRLLLFLLFAFPVFAQTSGTSTSTGTWVTQSSSMTWADPIATRAYKATALLYRQDESGGMSMLCTLTAYAKIPGGYLFVTASHCVSGQSDLDTDDSTKHIKISQSPMFITFDDVDSKEFLKAEIIAVGAQPKSDDFAILRVITKREIPVIPLGDESKESFGSPVLNVASPQGLGRQLMQGYISMPKLDRPVKEGEINWQNAVVLQIPAGPGSSGSSIISLHQEKIIAFLVGTVYGSNVAAIPVSRFKKFSQAINEHKYRLWGEDRYPKDMPVLPVD